MVEHDVVDRLRAAATELRDVGLIYDAALMDEGADVIEQHRTKDLDSSLVLADAQRSSVSVDL